MLQSSGKVKAGQLWTKSKDDLHKQLGELKTELGQLRTQKIAGGSASKLTKMCVYHGELDLEFGIRACSC
jgi:ribosomal protein L29